jgi:hypothetical protein
MISYITFGKRYVKLKTSKVDDTSRFSSYKTISAALNIYLTHARSMIDQDLRGLKL